MQLAGRVLQGLDEGQDEWPLSLVTELYVFGSFARGAAEPHDVDLDIEHESDYRWGSHFATCLAYGRDPYSLMKRPLTGGRQGCQITFRFKGSADFPIDELITLERVVLADDEVTSPYAREHLADRWSPSSPLRRAGRAIVADWERRGIDPRHCHLHGTDIDDSSTPYFAGFSWRYYTSIPRCLSGHGGTEWLEVVNPTRARPLDTLRILPRNRELLARVTWP